MSGNLAPNSRHEFSSPWLPAAVLLFIVCSDAARASGSPISTQANGEVRQSMLSSLFLPHHPPSTGRLPPETGTNSGTEMSRKSAEAISIANHQSSPPWFTGGVFSYNPSGPDWRQHSRGGIIRAQRGHSSGGVRPASGSFISHPEQGGKGAERPQTRIDYRPLSQKVVRISSQSQMWDSRDAQKSSNEAKLPRSDEISRPSPLGEYWSNSPSTQRAHKEMDELSALRDQSTSNRVQSSKFFGPASQTPFGAPSLAHAVDTSALRANPRPITDFSMQLNSVTSRPKIVQSYLFKDSQASSVVRGGQQHAMPQTQRASEVHIDNRFDSTSEELIRNDPLEEDNDIPPDQNKNVAQHEAQVNSFKTKQPVSSTYQPPLHPVSGQGKTLERFVPAPLAVSQDNYTTGREKYSTGSSVSTARGSARGHKPNRPTKTIYGVSGFKNLRQTSGRYSFNKGQYLNKYPSLSFGRIPTTTVSHPRPITSGLKDKIISRPLEGAIPPRREPVRPARRWLDVDVVGSQTWQPKSSRINTWKNNTDEAESNTLATQRQKEKSSGDEHSRFTPDKYTKKPRVYTFMGFQPLRDRITNSNWNYTTAASLTGKGSSSYLRSPAGLPLESSPVTHPTTHNKSEPSGMRARQLYRAPSRMVFGKRVRSQTNRSESFPTNAAIVRLPMLPVKVKGVTSADILGSASFGGVRATTQTPMTPADKKDSFPRAPAKTVREEGQESWASDDGGQSAKNSSTGAKDEDEGMKTFHAFPDNEGSGSGAFNASDVLSADRPQSQGLSEDLFQLDNLRTATENVSFGSVELSQPQE